MEKNKHILVIIGILVLAVGLSVFYGGLQKDDDPFESSDEEVISDINSIDEEYPATAEIILSGPEGWQMYENTGHGFSVSYPNDWVFREQFEGGGEYISDEPSDFWSTFSGTKKMSHIIFGPEGLHDLSSDFRKKFPKPWSVSVNDYSNSMYQSYSDLLKEDSIERFGVNEGIIFDGVRVFKLNEDRMFGTIDGQKSLIIKQTIDKSEGMPDWELTQIFIEKEGKIYIIKDFSRTDDVYETYSMIPTQFQKFYETFRFID